MAYADPNERLDAGRRQLVSACRRFFRQNGTTQPKWLAMDSAIHPGGQHLHSSQIGGLSTGKLKDPSPKCLLVVGELNLSVAASVGGYSLGKDIPRLPENLRQHWEKLKPMVDQGGQPLGPSELFKVISGDLDLGLDLTRELSVESEAAASAALGRHLRLELARKGRDFLSEMPELRSECPAMEPLLMGKTVPCDMIMGDLSSLANVINSTEAELWTVIKDAVI